MRFLTYLTAAALALGAACAANAQDTTPQSARVRAFNVDPATSVVYIRVFKDGVLSGLGHDHIITATGIAGLVNYDLDDVTLSSLQLSIPVASLVVDDPRHRAQAGLEGELSKDDIAEIHEIILSDDYLDEVNNPRVVATAVSVTGEVPVLSVGLSVRIKQTEVTYTVPVQLALNGGQLRATGEVYLKHSDFGMEPYSALLGTIAVKDPVLVKFDIVAKEQQP
jgi:polyisoprenoid-binding protein YceI